MDAQLMLDRINQLPHEVQQQLFDYVEFLLTKYDSADGDADKEKSNETLPDETKVLLQERLEHHRQHPDKAVTWQQMKQNSVSVNDAL